MDDDDDRYDRLKREAFGKLADRAKEESVGSGISKTTRFSVDRVSFAAVSDLEKPAWSQNREMIDRLFTPIFRRSHECPGRDKPQCCRAEPDEACSPNWREREDPEWYALEINRYLSLVNQRLESVTPITAALAADEAFELGFLFSEALIKFRWDRFAKGGFASTKGGKRGGDQKKSQLRRKFSSKDTYDGVNELVARGELKMNAYSLIGESQGASLETIRKEYRAYKKLMGPRG